MINLAYLRAELFRRRTKTILIALGLAVPIALTIIIGAYSTGLSNAQDTVLKPLVGLGTDMSVTKTFSPGQRPQGQAPPRVGLNGSNAGKTFSRNVFTTGPNTAFSDTAVTKVAKVSGLSEASGALTVSNIKVSGTIPSAGSQGSSGSSGSTGSFGPGSSSGQQGGSSTGTPPTNGSVGFNVRTITGIDVSSELGPISSDQLQKGTYLSDDDSKQALVSASYAKSNSLGLGDTVTLKGTKFTIVGIVSNPLAGSSSDIYVKLGQLQTIAGLEGKVNQIYVRAASQGDVATVSKAITTAVPGTTVTTNASLADQISGSLLDANHLVKKMGVFFVLALLAAAIVITTILTLNAVNKRTREFGTLKSVGWGNGLLIRQVMAESLSIGIIGAAAGAAIGLLVLLLAQAAPMTLNVSGSSSQGGFGGPGGGPGGGPPGFGNAVSSAASRAIDITPTISVNTVLLAAAVGAVTALVAGGLGSLKTSRLSPVEALKHVD